MKHFACVSALLFVIALIAATDARPMGSESSSPSASRRIHPAAQHIRTAVRKRTVETQVATGLARELAYRQRMLLLNNILKTINSGGYKANFKPKITYKPNSFVPEVSSKEADDFIKENVAGVNPGFKLEVKHHPKIFVPSKDTAPMVTNYEAQLQNAVRKAKLCIELQKKMSALGSRIKVNCD